MSNCATDFSKIFAFLAEHRWIHDFHVTKYFAATVWKTIPEEWITVFNTMTNEQLNRLPFLLSTVNSKPNHLTGSNQPQIFSSFPESLLLFLRESAFMSVDRDHSEMSLTPTVVEKELTKGMSPKKLHEVERMASLVQEVVVRSGCNIVVDVGSGLGYLGQVLHKRYGLPVIGLESCVGHSEGAERRSAKHGLHCPSVRSIPLEIGEKEEQIKMFCDVIRDILPTLKPCAHSFTTLPSDHQYSIKASQDTLHKTQEHELRNLKAQDQEADCTQPPHKSPNKVGGKQQKNSACCSVSDASNCQDASALHFNCMINKCSLHSSNCDTNINSISVEESYAPLQVQQEGIIDPVTLSNECLNPAFSCFENNDIPDKSLQLDSDCCKCSRSSCSKFTQPECFELIGCVEKSKELSNCRACLVGLHSCGDLIPAMLKLFQKVNFIKAICCVGCCYHKMQKTKGSGQFQNFPLSVAAKKEYTETCSGSDWNFTHFITTCSLRLAAQETRARWIKQSDLEHDQHIKNVAFRSLLQLCLEDEPEIQLNKKFVRKLNYSSFESFMHSFLTSSPCSEEKKSKLQKKMESLYSELQSHLHYIEPFTAPLAWFVSNKDKPPTLSHFMKVKNLKFSLEIRTSRFSQFISGHIWSLQKCLQMILQPVLESLILWDRQQWLYEHGFYADILPVFQEQISPRNLALVSIK